MSLNTKILGDAGEFYAAEVLKNEGYTILAKNFRAGRAAEVDIIAEYNGVIVFVEVKTRSNDKCGTPAEAVDLRKQKKIITAAMKYLQNNNLFDRACRFDVIEVFANENKNFKGWSINHIENAFDNIFM